MPAATPVRVYPTLACSTCGATITVRMTCKPVPSDEPRTLVLRVSCDRDDQAWLSLFEQSHRGPIVRA
jgi:hypothetical protein